MSAPFQGDLISHLSVFNSAKPAGERKRPAYLRVSDDQVQ